MAAALMIAPAEPLSNRSWKMRVGDDAALRRAAHAQAARRELLRRCDARYRQRHPERCNHLHRTKTTP
jgi:hypothetical protein